MFLYVKNDYNPEPEMVLSGQVAPDTKLVEYWGAPLYLLPRTVEEWERSKGSKYWKNIRRSQRLFEEEYGPLSFDMIRERDDLLFWLPRIHDLFTARWAERYISSPWKTEEGFQKYAAAMLDLAQKDLASIAVLYRGDELLSFSYNLHGSQVFYFYQHATKNSSAYRKYSLGKIFLTKLLRELIASGRYVAFDFMVGDAGYKYEWADCTQRVFCRLQKRSNESRLGFRFRVCSATIKIWIQKNDRLKGAVLQILSRFERLRKNRKLPFFSWLAPAPGRS